VRTEIIIYITGKVSVSSTANVVAKVAVGGKGSQTVNTKLFSGGV
jgi:hypothetical protein